jgi:hypothetical protein
VRARASGHEGGVGCSALARRRRARDPDAGHRAAHRAEYTGMSRICSASTDTGRSRMERLSSIASHIVEPGRSSLADMEAHPSSTAVLQHYTHDLHFSDTQTFKRSFNSTMLTYANVVNYRRTVPRTYSSL